MFPIHTYAELEIFHLHTYTVQCKDATYSIVPRLIAHRQPRSRAACTHCWSVHYNLPSLSSNWYQALIPSNTSSRSIKIPPGIRRHLLQLLPVIMDIVIPENIHTCIPISPSSYMGKFGKASLHFSHQLFLHPIRLRSTMHEAAGMVNLSLCISKTWLIFISNKSSSTWKKYIIWRQKSFCCKKLQHIPTSN